MIKKTLFFSQAVCLSLKNKQLVVYNKETQQETTRPIEDIGFVVIESNLISISIPLINALADNNSAVIFCNEKHLPYSMNLPLDCNIIQNQVFAAQINSSLPIKKRCWKEIIERKIINQAKVLEKYRKDSKLLSCYAENVKSGDTTNREAAAAKVYWDFLISPKWTRDRFGDYPNNFLNYGYAILRAATARALVGSGLLPTLGIHHCNKYNAYCLADDIMEPYRPYIDDEVISFMEKNPDEKELTIEFKRQICEVLTRDVSIGSVTRPLMIALSITSSSLVKVFNKEELHLQLPFFV